MILPRERNPNRDKAREIYQAHDGKITNREIAAILGEDEKVIAVWKGRDRWGNVVQQSKESCTTKKKGGQPGNKNTKGNRGGAAPEKNKNAVTTGEFETLLFDCLEPDERRLADAVPADKERLLLQEIRLLTVREYRMLRRIEDLKHTEEYFDNGESAAGMTVVSRKTGIEKGHETDLKEFQGKLGQIQAVEDALTRVQARKQRAIETLHKFGFDDARLEIELARLELAALKVGGQEAEEEDDGFLDAMNAQVGELWGDADAGERLRWDHCRWGHPVGKNRRHVFVLRDVGHELLQWPELCHVRQDHRILQTERALLAETDAPEPGIPRYGSPGGQPGGD